MTEDRKLDPIIIGRRLRELRGVFRTQQDVADATGIPRTTICAYEVGRMLPTPQAMVALADYFGKPVQDIFFT